ncbi:tRNA (N(6)-L-threonylcarbamoyladenosine(37)-C(2))-methylthiotransferase [Candidatus Woesearchaeota archaeon]|nr:tRNA (N(6)-L-threonylcarbamoyladenosine(37)-C(2))-methylthiotransferase [Candidatus Woesearchaeota archaeon]
MRIFIKTYGCTLNQSDSELMSGLLELAGHEIVLSEKESELVVFNTCTVKDSPEKRFYSDLSKARKAGKRVVVAGCVSQADPSNEALRDVSIVGVRNLELITEAVDAATSGGVVKLLDFQKNKRLGLPRIRKNPVVEIIPISAGCLGECTFCKTRLARGSLYSYQIADIKSQMEEAIAGGAKEVWLTSQDAGAYGKDIGRSLPGLLDELVEISGDYRIRLGMINPNHAQEMAGELIRFLKHPKAFKFIHLPVQSGSDHVLKMMKRKYSAHEFSCLVNKLRVEVPGVTVVTDIICGFPEETLEDHETTKRLLRELKIPVLNLTKFYPRKGTPAASMKLIPTKEVKRRSLDLVELQKSLVDNKEWIGWEGLVLIDENGKGKSMVGRNDYYKPVAFEEAGLSLGMRVDARITNSEQHFLTGRRRS